MIVVVNELSSQQSDPTKVTITKCNMLMDYAHTYSHAAIRVSTLTPMLLT